MELDSYLRSGQRLEKPVHCDRELYNLMMQARIQDLYTYETILLESCSEIFEPDKCWELDMNKRPSFADIETFLNAHYKRLAGGIYKEYLQ